METVAKVDKLKFFVHLFVLLILSFPNQLTISYLYTQRDSPIFLINWIGMYLFSLMIGFFVGGIFYLLIGKSNPAKLAKYFLVCSYLLVFSNLYLGIETIQKIMK